MNVCLFILAEICKQNSCLKFQWAASLEERNKLWQARHSLWFALKALNPGRKVENEYFLRLSLNLYFCFFV